MSLPTKTPKPKGGAREGAGRKKIEIDYDKVRDLARFMYTDEELAVGLGVSVGTIEGRRRDEPEFRQAVQEGHANGKKSLRAMQFAVAMKGNVGMLIWLGKQYLEQKDKSQLGGDPNAPLIPRRDVSKLSAEELLIEIAATNDRLRIAGALPAVVGIRRDPEPVEAAPGAADTRTQ